MTRALLDVNVLLALLDSDHIDHRRAHEWLDDEIQTGWASCAITENGFVRVISQPRYPSPISPREAIELLAPACSGARHAHWPCSLSILDADVFDHSRVHGPRQVTDAYLLALARVNGGRFVAFDRAVAISAVRSARAEDLVVID